MAATKQQQQQHSVRGPLSVITKDCDVPLVDVQAWVKRPTQDRWNEVMRKRKGRIPRPLNCFMIYRKAFSERIKRWSSIHRANACLISSIAGDGWRLEPADVKEHYVSLASQERKHHAIAFPNYTFAPNRSTQKRYRDDKECHRRSDRQVFGPTHLGGVTVDEDGPSELELWMVLEPQEAESNSAPVTPGRSTDATGNHDSSIDAQPESAWSLSEWDYPGRAFDIEFGASSDEE